MEEAHEAKPRDLKMRTKAFALRIIRLYAALPKTTEAQVLGKQMLRSGTSVGAHYREAQRAKSNGCDQSQLTCNRSANSSQLSSNGTP